MIIKGIWTLNVSLLQQLQFNLISDHKHTLFRVFVVTVLDNGV